VATDVAVPLDFSDFSDEIDPDAAAASWIETLFWQPIAPIDFPLFQFAIAKLAKDRFLWLQKYHHLIIDATGRQLVAARVLEVYEALSAGVAPTVMERNAFLDVASTSDCEYRASNNWANDEAYWRTRLAALPNPLVQIDTHFSEKSRAGRPQELAWDLSRQESDELREFARLAGSTVNQLLLVLVWCCISRLYDRSDIILGLPLANRKSAIARRTVGQFSKAMPFRPRLNSSMSIAEALAALNTDLRNDLKHQQFPFHQLNCLLRRSGPDGLFDVIVNFQRNDYGFSFGGELVTCTNISVGFSVPWSIAVFEYAAGAPLQFAIRYDAGRISMEEATRFQQSFQELLRCAKKSAGIALAHLPMISVDVQAELLRKGVGKRVAIPEAATLATLLAEQAARTPDATAIICGEDRLTYADLHAQAERLSRRLIKVGVGADTLVGVYLPRTFAMIVAVVAIHKAGGAYLPLDPGYPQHRLTFMVGDSNTKVIVTDGCCAPLLDVMDAQILLIDECERETDGSGAYQPCDRASPRDLAYVLYTSGSTGTPKGIAVTHGNAANLILWARRLVNDDDISGVLFATSLNFDISVYEMFLPLAFGGAIILVEDLFEILTAPSRNKVSLVNSVPSLMDAVVQQGGLPAGVRVVNLAGETLGRKLADRIFAACRGIRLFNCYGPTETTVYSTWSEVGPEDGGPPPIGRPIFNTEVYVLDNSLQLVPPGCIGELWIGGKGVSRGYLNLAELNQQRFRSNPFGDGRIYATGDLAAWQTDGQLKFAGRIDHQLKIRGCRIEPGEIESALRLHPAVKDAVVVMRPDTAGGGRLVAYVTTAASLSPVFVDELRNWLMEGLPIYMIPSVFVLLDAFPLAPNGKLNRKALPAVPQQLAHHSRSPRTPTEKQLASVWCELLNLKNVGVDDNFFEQGGHSLLAMRVISRILRIWAVDIPLRFFFEYPTISGLANQIESLRATMQRSAAIAASHEAVETSQNTTFNDDSEPPRSSSAQQRLWFHAQMEGANRPYHISLDVRLRGRLDRDGLRWALDTLIRRHDALRTTFQLRDGQPVQQIAAAGGRFSLAEFDLRSQPNVEAELRRHVDEEATAPFDLELGPIIRGRLLLLSDDEHALLITIHHIASDGWSMGVLTQELSRLYTDGLRGRTDSSPALPMQYSDFAVWQRQRLQHESLQREAAYWKAQLTGAPVFLELPADRPRPPRQDFAGASVRVTLDAELAQSIKAQSQRHGVTVFMTLMAAWATLLSRLSGQDEVVIGTATHNRTRTDIEPLIGVFVNTLALRIDLSGSPTTSELLARVRAVFLSAQENDDIPFEQVVELVQPPRSLAHTPLFQVIFVWQNTPQGKLELPGIQVVPITPPNATAKLDLSLSLEEEGAAITGSLEYATSLFDRETIERFLHYWRNLLEAMTTGDAQAIDCLPLVREKEQVRLLSEWNSTAAEYPRDKCLHSLFEEQVTETPDAVAVEFNEQKLTYAELNAQANRLANYLRARGVRERSYICVCIERSPEMIVTLLAILKVGCAYVAFDLDNPLERLRSILADTQPAAIVVKSQVQGATIESLTSEASRDPADATVVVCLAEAAGVIGCASPTNPTGSASSESPAYVCFTSGSTGKPKGVIIQHRAVVRLVKNTNYVSILREDVFFQFAPISFDASIFEIWGCLINGARLVVAPPQLMSFSELGSLIRQKQVTVLWLTAGLFHAMVDHELDNLVGLRKLLAGGDTLSTGHVRRALERMGEGTLINGYGPTENTTFTCCHLITRSSAARQSIPIGVPISNTQCFILDRHLQPVPVGARGELYAGGDGLALGYLNDPRLTTERFISNPFRPGSRLYRTGDFARHLPDGNIEFLGRIDDQVKIRGFRVTLGEVEAIIRRHPLVQDAAVLTEKENAGDNSLVAYVSPRNVDGLQEFLKESLPAYMRPATIVYLDILPLTESGKLDRKALPSARDHSVHSQSSPVAPRTATERALTEIWGEMLGRSQIDIGDNFFDMGGHSLMVIRLVDRVNRTLNVHLSISDLFQNPTIGEMARAIDELPIVGRTYPAGIVQIQPGSADRPVFYLPSLGGTAFEFAPLSAKLETSRSMLGIEFHDLKVDDSVFRSMERMADVIIQRIREVQPVGPYTLMGYSFGGNLAVEVATQLIAVGEVLEPVILLDAYARGSLRELLGIRRLAVHVRILRRLDFKQSCRYVFSGIQHRLLFRRSEKSSDRAIAFEDGVEQRLGKVSKACAKAFKTHVPQAFSGRIVLLRATDISDWVEVVDRSGSNGWSSMCEGGADVISINCGHLDVFKEPHVTLIAAQLGNLLNSAEDGVVLHSSMAAG
jgi:amino acid adenylation domain-containing protein